VTTLEKLKRETGILRVKFKKSGISKAGIIKRVSGIQDQEPWNLTTLDSIK